MQEPWRELPRGFYHLADGAGEDEAYVQFHGRPPIPLSQELLGTLNHQVADEFRGMGPLENREKTGG